MYKPRTNKEGLTVEGVFLPTEGATFNEPHLGLEKYIGILVDRYVEGVLTDLSYKPAQPVLLPKPGYIFRDDAAEFERALSKKGVVGNGTVDDSGPLQEAISSMLSPSKRRRIFFQMA